MFSNRPSNKCLNTSQTPFIDQTTLGTSGVDRSFTQLDPAKMGFGGYSSACRTGNEFLLPALSDVRSHLTKAVLSIALIVFSFCFAQTGHAKPFSEIITFGDSLSEVGNVAGVTLDDSSPRINGYFEQTHFSDNVIWVEQLAEYWGLPPRTPGRGDITTLASQPDGNTWTWGGSEAAEGTVTPDGVTEPIPNLLTEVSQYLLNNSPDRFALFSIWSGADNLIVGGKFGPDAAVAAVSAVTQAMKELESAGARHFLILNMPKLGDTPDAQSGGTIDRVAANIYSRFYNTELRKQLLQLRDDRQFKGRIYLVDTYTELELIVDTVNSGLTYEPSFFVPGPPVEISNVTDLALDVFQDNGTFPTDYFFWDHIHPTTVAHQVIAGLVLQTLQQNRFEKGNKRGSPKYTSNKNKCLK